MAEWVSVSTASAALGVSPRAIQKRAARGTLAARKVERGGAEVWEIDGRELGANMDASTRTDGREPANLLPQVDANTAPIHAQNGREPVRQIDAARFANAGTVDANRAAEYRAEIAFLRATIEQHQRSEAELRASLREALKAMPKAITSGAAQSAPGREISPLIETSGQSDAARSNGAGNAPESGGPTSYAAIADWLEGLE